MESHWCYNDVRFKPSTRDQSIIMTSAKFGEVVDIYIMTKKGAKKKCLAFVRFKKVVDEYGLEKAFQGVKCGCRILDVNIARIERKPVGPSECGNIRNRLHNRIPSTLGSKGRVSRSYVTVVTTCDRDSTRILPPPPQMKVVPTRISDDSPLQGWIKGLLPELWSEENFTAIVMTYVQVVVSFVMDQTEANLSFGKVGILTSSLTNIYYESLVEFNSKIMKIGIVEVDIDCVPLKSHMRQLDMCSSSDDDGNDNEGDDDEDHNTADIAWSPMADSLSTNALNDKDGRRIERNRLGER
ncbi:unnamed protein product [Lactuca saligna]|uniref:RRM domain-containing protein n=1 Tax=Lactuca saligna TaxID=75948 RepID=A0AA35YVD5_LACSI|nr:unnamed protein product [Lactuca saligna]